MGRINVTFTIFGEPCAPTEPLPYIQLPHTQGYPIQHTAKMLRGNFPTGLPILAQPLSLNPSLRKGQ